MISAAAVKELREKTGAGMMDCKKALKETDGDMEKAVDWLRKKGLASAQKKSGRVAADGLVAVACEGQSGAVVEINAETDFVARNAQFQGFVANVAKAAVATPDVDALAQAQYPGGTKTVADQLTDMIAGIGENMTLRRSAGLSVSNGTVSSYVHSAVAPNMGKIGVLVALETEAADKQALAALGKQLCMHIAAAKPEAVDVDSLDQALVERERTVLSDQARASGKPEEIIAKMVEGRIRKFYEEVVLLEQVFVMDTDKKVKAVLEQAGKDLGAPVALKDFVLFILGEGVEKKEENFADEVSAVLAR